MLAMDRGGGQLAFFCPPGIMKGDPKEKEAANGDKKVGSTVYRSGAGQFHPGGGKAGVYPVGIDPYDEQPGK